MAKNVVKGSPELMQKLNTSLVLELIKEHGPISRSELARRTRLSNPTISILIAPLIEEGIVQEVGTAASTGGRPARLLQFNAKAGYLVGVDIGGTNMVGASVDLAGEVMVRRSFSSARGRESVEALTALIDDLIQATDLPRDSLRGIGLGIPGITDPSGQEVSLAPGVGWDNLSIGSILQEHFQVPLFADNDVNCFTRGELWRGALRGVTNGAAITIGTGIGVGLVIDKHVYRGTRGAAGEVGYWLLGALGPIERAAGYGPLESIAAGPGIARQARLALEQDPSLGSILRQVVDGDVKKVTAKEVFAAAREGDSLCQELVERTTLYLGILLANMASLLDLETIVVGGGVSRAGAQLLDPLRWIVNQLAPYPPEIEISQLQEDATILGAVSSVLDLRESYIQFSQLDWER